MKQAQHDTRKRRRVAAKLAPMLALVLAGELVFSLPFHVPRYFRPTVLEVFALNNAELGDIFAAYGVAAMLAYFPGGVLADRFTARTLLTWSLLATAAGGVYFATLPGVGGLTALYAYWGVTTIFLFWGALIRATRWWGGALAQGRAFGILDGGRGLAAACFASLTVTCFALVSGATASAGTRNAGAALQTVIACYTATTCGAALCVWRWSGNGPPPPNPNPCKRPRQTWRSVFTYPQVWLQAGIIVCAYCGYKGLDNYALYAHDVLAMTDVQAAALTAALAYIRPPAAILAGLLADRYKPSNTIGVLFAILALSYGLLALTPSSSWSLVLVIATVATTCAAVFALRGVYFALIGETQVPLSLTGATVGLVSVVGYTPDIFFAPLGGRILDAAPGLPGHQHYFMLLCGIGICGFVLTVAVGHLGIATPTLQRSE